MKLTLKDAEYCLRPKPNGCKECKFNKQGEVDCRGEALTLGADAINYLMVGQKLANELEKEEVEDGNNN